MVNNNDMTPDPSQFGTPFDTSVSDEQFVKESKLQEEVQTAVENNSLLHFVTGADLMKMDIPEPEVLLYPWLRRGVLAMICAETGIGKTWLSMTIATALARGGSIFDDRWFCPKPRRVMYIDGEMSLFSMRKRLAELGGDCDNFLLVNPDLDRDAPAINLANCEWQQKILRTIDAKGVDVIVLDNVSSLYRVESNSNSIESWQPMQDFLWKLRRKDIGTVLVDHKGKNPAVESARGTSGKSDILNFTITLKRPEGYDPSDGASFVISFGKFRDLTGDEVNSFLATLANGSWSTELYKAPTKTPGAHKKEANVEAVRQAYLEAVDAGQEVSPSKISNDTGVPLGSVNRYIANFRLGHVDSAGDYVVTNDGLTVYQ